MRSVSAVVVVGIILVSVAQGQPHGPTPVVVVPIVERDLPAALRLVGTVQPQRSAVVAAEVAGVVAELPANEGDSLKQGEVICRLDAHTAELHLTEAQARLGTLRKQLEELEAGPRAEVRRQLAASMEEAKAIFEKWEFERRRVNDLAQQNQASAKEIHDTEMEYLAAKQRLTWATAAHEIAVNGTRPEELARARFDVAAQEAVVKRLERDLAKTQIAAPFDGFLVAKRTEVGEWIDAGGAVCEMVAIDTVKVRADVPEAAIPYAVAGSPASVTIEALGRSLAAKVSRVIPRATPAARTFPVEIDLSNGDHTLLPGMFVWVHVACGPAGKRLLVNKDAIVPRGTAKQLYVIRPGPQGGELAVPLDIETGLEVNGEIEVRGPGLSAGDKVVVRANERLYGPTPVVSRPLNTAASQPALK